MFTERQATQLLGVAYDNAPVGEKMLSIQLFGIRYADRLEGTNLGRLALEATGNELGVELLYGVKLAAHVILKQTSSFEFNKACKRHNSHAVEKRGGTIRI